MSCSKVELNALLQWDTAFPILTQHLSIGTLASRETDFDTGVDRVSACKWIPRACHTAFEYLAFDRTTLRTLLHTFSCRLVKNFAPGTVTSRHTNQWTEGIVLFVTACERPATTAQALGEYKASWTPAHCKAHA